MSLWDQLILLFWNIGLFYLAYKIFELSRWTVWIASMVVLLSLGSIFTFWVPVIYICIGVYLSFRGAPLGWDMLLGRNGIRRRWNAGNIPFFVFMWPWPVAAQAYMKLTGRYPKWSPFQ